MAAKDNAERLNKINFNGKTYDIESCNDKETAEKIEVISANINSLGEKEQALVAKCNELMGEIKALAESRTALQGQLEVAMSKIANMHWEDIKEKPETYKPSEHSHDEAYPSKTGERASGTWNIDIKGKAETAGKADSAAIPEGFVQRATSADWGKANQTGECVTDWHTAGGGDISFRQVAPSPDANQRLNVIIDGDYYANEGNAVVLHENNFNDFAPTKTGAGATGTWDINITGKANAADAAEVSNTSWGKYTGNGGKQPPSYFGRERAGFLMSDQNVNGHTGYKNWLYMDNYSYDDVGGASAIGVARDSARAFIMSSDATRSDWNWNAELLSTANYNNYAPTKTGIGASGTWGIDITGTANAATRLVDLSGNNGDLINDHGTLNDEDTWIPVFNRGKIQHTEKLRMTVGAAKKLSGPVFCKSDGDSATVWFKVAEYTSPNVFYDANITFMVRNTYANDCSGILVIRARAGETNAWESGNIFWLTKHGFDDNDFVLIHNTNTPCKVELWTRILKQYEGRQFTVLGETHRDYEARNVWTISDSITAPGATSYTTGMEAMTSGLGGEIGNAKQLQGMSLFGPHGSGTSYNAIPFIQTDGVMEVGKHIDFHAISNDGTDYVSRFTAEDNGTVTVGTINGTLNGDITGFGQPRFNNGTWYLVGDDAYIGDFNRGGTLGIKGANDTTAIALCNWENQDDCAFIRYNGGNLIFDKTLEANITGRADVANRVDFSAPNGQTTTLVQGVMGGSDYGRIAVWGTNDESGLEIATADNGNEPIVARQYNLRDNGDGSNTPFGIITRTAEILGGDGDTRFPQTVHAPWFDGNYKIASHSVQWIDARDYAPLRQPVWDNYSPFSSIRTQNGTWDNGAYMDNILHWSFIRDEDYNARDNRQNGNIQFRPDGSIVTTGGFYGQLHGSMDGFACSGAEIPRNCNDMACNSMVYYTSGGPDPSIGASTTDGALYAQAYNGSWVGQIAQDYRNGSLFVRGKNDGSWTPWKRMVWNEGTWNINITGSSESSTRITEREDIRYGANDLQYFNLHSTSRGDAHNNGTPADDWYHIIRMNHGNNNGYFVDLAMPFHSDDTAFRRIVNGEDQGWSRILNDRNYNNYAPTKTGGGASGTWGINITGKSEYAQNAEYIGNDNQYMRFHWDGRDGQPPWLWGGSDPAHMYVYNPSNFSVANSDTVDGCHEYNFLRYRDAVGGGTDTLWNQIGIRQYNGGWPAGVGDGYTWGAVVSLPAASARLDIWYNHQCSENGDGLAYRSGWDDDKKRWVRILDTGNFTRWAAARDGDTIYTNNWFRSRGNTGWYNEDYGGGWYMEDTTWIRAWGGKNIYTSGTMRCDGEMQCTGLRIRDMAGVAVSGWDASTGTLDLVAY